VSAGDLHDLLNFFKGGGPQNACNVPLERDRAPTVTRQGLRAGERVLVAHDASEFGNRRL
jgi:hypothetical protein